MPMRMIGAAAVVLCGLAACGTHTRTVGGGGASGSMPRLVGAHPCVGIPGFSCAWLTVPLDHGGQARGSLRLAVGVQQVPRPPRGTLLFLAGGPGQPGVSLIARIRARLAAEFAGYRLVMFDQRGTGAGALQCPALQAAAGSSDLVVAPRDAVAGCARTLGPARRFYSTPETVADIEALRVALRADRLTLDGVSYGSFVAERYALTYPERVARLVLDSVLPQQGVGPLYLASIEATDRVLREACAAMRCQWDPAHDVRAVVRAYDDGPQLLNALVAESIVVPSFSEVLVPLHEAALGHPEELQRFLALVANAEGAPADELSQGLHESTLCLDLAAPWNPATPSADRAAALRQAVAQVPASGLFPFDRATAYGNGLAQDCLDWPPTTPPGLGECDPSADLPDVPILLLAGQRDLSTPLAWAREEAVKAPDGNLVIVAGAGHSVQTRAQSRVMREILTRFLAG
jgi:pimeloyl-ACP methyl ester carboxylesterase